MQQIAKPTVDVVVAGHRDLFGTPRALDQAGLLRYLVTDLYVGKGSWLSPTRALLPYGPRLFRKLLARDSRLPSERIIANNFAGLKAWRDLRKSHDAGESAIAHRALAHSLASCAKKSCLPSPDTIVGYRMSDELFREFKGRSQCVLCQNDGGSHEVRVVRDEHGMFPDWGTTQSNGQSKSSDWLDLEEQRLQHEWQLADVIVCWSNWTRECVVQQGIDSTKCVVLPPPFAPSSAYTGIERNFFSETFVIGFLGTLSIRKGTPRLLQSLRVLSDSGIRVKAKLAGVNKLNPQRLAEFDDLVDYLGVIPHSQIPSFFEQIHCLCLPSVSEGLAMVQLEAMASGLPVICTDRCGDAVRHEQDGLVIPPNDSDALVEALRKLGLDRDLLTSMGQSALERVKNYSLQKTAERWKNLIVGC